MQKIPYLLMLGPREVESKKVSVRERGGKDLGAMSVESLIELLKKR